MNVETDSQAMTEVALGLAMAFFAMMILAMMSMSMPSDDVVSLAISKVGNSNITFKEGVKIVANNKGATAGEGASRESQKNMTYEKASDENIIIFYQDRYFDISLQPLNVATLGANSSTNFSTTKRYILALPPDLSLSDALIAREKISSPNLTITQLDEAWLKRLAL
ncbi:hypothetical protein A9Q81_19090 [Gammaproteobacteria bacterium 42_54_T18]|nr:hypothetical protein A9Q81_19090 [Gammaproteobacteria bacterium 42_54_T18]